MRHPQNREQLWQQLSQPWDLIIIGGGITGAGILREATRVGLRALLIEADDFAAGTSSRSSKLVHGGFRYLKNAQLKMTLTSVRERERLLQEGRGLITQLGFLFVHYQRDRFPPWLFGMGLALYDLLAMLEISSHESFVSILDSQLGMRATRWPVSFFLSDDRASRAAIAPGLTHLFGQTGVFRITCLW